MHGKALLDYIVEIGTHSALPFGTGWCFLREPHITERDSFSGKDLDLWCSYSTETELLARFLNDGWQIESGREISFSQQANESNRTYHLRLPDSPGPRIELFVGALRWSAHIYLSESAVLNSINTSRSGNYIGGAALLSVLITRVALRGELRDQRLRRAREAWSRATDVAKCIWYENNSAILGHSTTKDLQSFVELKRGRPPSSIRLKTTIQLRRPRRLASISSKGLSIVFRKLKARLVGPTGVLCFFIGTDGAGKTSLCCELQAEVEQNGLLAVQLYWGRARENSLLVSILRRLSFYMLSLIGVQTKKTGKDQNFAGPPPESTKHKAYRTFASIGAAIYLFEYWWRFAVAQAKYLLWGKSVIVDRSAYDLATMKGVPASATSLYRFAPRADICVFCSAPAEVIFARKPERELAEIEHQQLTYSDIMESERKNGAFFLGIDTSKSSTSNITIIGQLFQSLYLNKLGRLDAGLIPYIIRALERTASIRKPDPKQLQVNQ